MTIRRFTVERFSIDSPRPFDEVVRSVDAEIGHPDMTAFVHTSSATATLEALEDVVRRAVGPTDLMEFMRLDIGGVLGKGRESPSLKSLRLIVGNPLIMRRMAERVPDAGSYAPVTVLIDERGGGVRLSYDRMASFLDPYGDEEAIQVAIDLDIKVERLLSEAAGLG
jgi:hypothetical protein